MAGRVEVKGAAELSASLGRLSRDLADMPNAQQSAASTVAAAGSAGAPRRTGRLAGSLVGTSQKSAAVIRSGVVYAPTIHWGSRARNIRANPFLTRAADATQPRWTAIYRNEVERLVGRVKGA
jgi:phage gpG-like protein